MIHISPARVAAFDALKAIEGGKFSSVVLANTDPQLSSLDRALCHELVMGVLRWRLQLDSIIQHFAKRTTHALDLPVLLALRLGVYQLRFLSRVPASAAVNESVNLVGRSRLSSARPFVNAVLRSVAREPDYSPSANISDSLERLAVETSHPRWLIASWTTSFGIEKTESFARANNEPPPVAIRVVNTTSDKGDLLDELRSAGADVTPSGIAERGWRVSGAIAKIRELVERGDIYIQDEASQLVGEVLNAKPGERVLDACAAPGGKTTLIAHWTGDSASVVAMDISAHRLSTVAHTIKVQRLKRVSLMVADAAGPLPFQREIFDRVLLDAPCSGTGTLRHNPEIRWRLTENDINRLAEQQYRLLQNAASVVRQGGMLVYSTCSVEREENEDVVADFLMTNEQFRQIRVPVNESLRAEGGAARTWPQRDGTDGFYIAAFEHKLDK